MDAPATAERIVRLESQVADLHNDVHEIKSDVKEIRNSLSGRPSWAITLALTVLSSLVVGLATALATLR